MTAVSLWEALWTGATEILAVTLQYVQSALAFYVDFFEVVVESLVQFGLWVWKVVSEAAAVVQAMVGAAQEAFGQVVAWVWNFIVATMNATFGPLVDAIVEVLNEWGRQLLSAVQDLFSVSPDAKTGSPPADPSLAATTLLNLLTQPALAFIAIFTSLRIVEAVIAISTGSIIGLQFAKEAVSQFLQDYVIYLIFQAFLWGTVALLADTVAGDVDSIVVDAFTEVGFFFGLLGVTIEVVKKVVELKKGSGEPSPVRRAWAAGLAFTGLLIMLMTDLLGLGTSGLLLLVMDAFGYFLVWYNAIEYRERSKDLENKAIDLPSPISSKLEAVTTYGTVGLGGATIGVHAAEGRYW
jgi:hypothetical protein